MFVYESRIPLVRDSKPFVYVRGPIGYWDSSISGMIMGSLKGNRGKASWGNSGSPRETTKKGVSNKN